MSDASMQNTKAVNRLDLLVVDDNELTLEIVAWALRGVDLNYQLCGEASEALKVLSENIPRTLIVDYFMPGTNGIELLEAFSKLPESDTCPIFLCSSAKLTSKQLEFLGSINAQVIDKDQLCNKASILDLVQRPVLAING